MHTPIMETLNKAELCPKFIFVATPFKADKKSGTREAVDGGLYPTKGAPRPTKGTSKRTPSCATKWTAIEVCIECKTGPVSGDPFDELQRNNASVAKERQKILGQILAYAQLVYDNQQRTSQFMLLFLGTSAHIVHIDRSGIFATKKINYKDDATYLLQFVWRLARLDPSKRGHDSTAERITHGSAIGVKMKAIADKANEHSEYAHLQFKELLNPSATWWRLTVKDELADGKERKFLVGKPHFNAPGAKAPTFVYLKDAWRVVHEDIDKEGDTLRTLNDLGVPYIPTVLHHGDLGQITASPALWVKYHPDVPPGTRCPLKKHSYYRLVVKEVWRPLEDFANGEELVSAIYCCVTAHSKAYAAGIIHRDISAGNMLLYTDSEDYVCGLLNDWELSKHFDDDSPEGRRLDRTGTWQFLSVFALDDPKKKIVVPDELESFFHVLLYEAICFIPHNCENVGAFLYNYFEDYLKHSNSDYRCGPAKKGVIKKGYIDLDDQGVGEASRLVFLMQGSEPGSYTPHPINNLIGDLLSWFSAYYRLNKKDPQPRSGPLTLDAPRPRRRNKLGDPGDKVEGRRRTRNLLKQDSAMTPEEEEKIRLRAEELDGHTSFLLRLKDVSEEGWPGVDKGLDMRPEGGFNPSSGVVPSSSTAGISGAGSNTSAVIPVPNPVSFPIARPISRPAPLTEKDIGDGYDSETPLSKTVRILKRPSSNVDGLEPPSTPMKRAQRD